MKTKIIELIIRNGTNYINNNFISSFLLHGNRHTN
jgi:hypothetical protein